MTENDQPARGRIMTRAEICEIFGIALTTLDAWVRRGCPVLKKSGKGVPSEYDSAAVFEWALIQQRRF